MPAAVRAAFVLAVLSFLLAVLAGCAGSEAVTEAQPPEPVPEAPAGPAFLVVYFDEAGLHLHDVRADRTQTLHTGGSVIDHHDPSPGGDLVPVAYAHADSSVFGLVDVGDGTFRRLHAGPGRLVYTSAWTLDGRQLAFGFYPPRGDDDRGDGGIRIASIRGGEVKDVGCSASNTVEGWRPDGRLIVGDGSNAYVVDADDCRTVVTVPLRKKHFVTFSPDGERVAYIFRDLVYNRDRRAYEPDSSLYIADYRGMNEEKVAGDRYRPRNLRWSPDSERLAFDVRSPDDPDFRHVAYYTVATGESTFMVQADEGGIPSEGRPVWSPGGDRIALDRAWPSRGIRQKAVRGFDDIGVNVLLERPLDEPLPETWGWVDDEHVILADADGTKHVYSLGGSTVYSVPAGRTLVAVRSRP